VPDVLRVACFTTSYPNEEGDWAGNFVAALNGELERLDVELVIVGPEQYRHFGLCTRTGAGFVGNFKRRPWLGPLALVSMALALRRAARGVQLVHAHWLASALVARVSGKPFVVTLQGTPTAGRYSDIQLATRHRRLVRRLLRPALAIIAVSKPLAEAVERCGLSQVHYIPNGVHLPEVVEAEQEPPHILFAARLSPEKRIDVLAAATEGLTRVVVGDGPERWRVPDALGFLPHPELLDRMTQAALLLLTSADEGLPLVMLEAMARGRAVVATPVGGIPAVIRDGENGLIVPVGDVAATRGAVERLLADRALRKRLGDAARKTIEAGYTWPAIAGQTAAIYRAVS
jgi:glycosyltransferase involved in cell wall biosynthesis